MTATNVKSQWVDGDLYFYDKSGNEIAHWDGTNRKLVVPNGSTLEVAGVTVDSSTLAMNGLTASAAELNLLDGAADVAANGLGFLRVARATFNPSATAGERTIAAHGLGVTIPDDAIIVGGFVEVNTTFTSATDAATVAINVEGANDIVSAIAISDVSNPWDAGRKAIVPKANTPESTSVKLSAAREITATVAVEALTAGKATVFLYYVVGA